MLDISDRKRIEQELETQRQQLEAIIGSAMDAMITVDERQRVLLFNRAAESMFQCPATDVIGQALDRFIPERFRQAHRGHIQAFAQSGGASPRLVRQGMALVGLRATGEEFPIEASISQVTVDGKALFTVIIRDISERQAAEEALQASESFTRDVLDSLSAHICVLDTDKAANR